MAKRDPRHCSFCAKSEDEVSQLIGAKDSVFIFICNECVDLCHDMIHLPPSVPEEERG
jgi:ATP-dependent Clp protease ATP-binding subunit ClpX